MKPAGEAVEGGRGVGSRRKVMSRRWSIVRRGGAVDTMGDDASVSRAVEDRAVLVAEKDDLHRSVEARLTTVASAIDPGELDSAVTDDDSAVGMIGAAESGEVRRLVGAEDGIAYTSHGRSDALLYDTADCGLDRVSPLPRRGEDRDRVLVDRTLRLGRRCRARRTRQMSARRMIRTPKPATAMAQMATLLSPADNGDAVAVEVGWASATVAEASSV